MRQVSIEGCTWRILIPSYNYAYLRCFWWVLTLRTSCIVQARRGRHVVAAAKTSFTPLLDSRLFSLGLQCRFKYETTLVCTISSSSWSAESAILSSLLMHFAMPVLQCLWLSVMGCSGMFTLPWYLEGVPWEAFSIDATMSRLRPGTFYKAIVTHRLAQKHVLRS